MTINIFNIHYEVSAYMFNNQDKYAHLDLIQRHQLAERLAVEFFKELQFTQKQLEENPITNKDLLKNLEVEFVVINDDLYDTVSTFIESKSNPKPTKREV